MTEALKSGSYDYIGTQKRTMSNARTKRNISHVIANERPIPIFLVFLLYAHTTFAKSGQVQNVDFKDAICILRKFQGCMRTINIALEGGVGNATCCE